MIAAIILNLKTEYNQSAGMAVVTVRDAELLCLSWEKRLKKLIQNINPVMLLILFSLLAYVLRRIFFPEFSDAALVNSLEQLLATFGLMSIVYLLSIYFFCSFFFIPILIPLNIACGALYGAVPGAGIALCGVLVSCFASTVSVRYVFRGLGKYAMEHQNVKDYLNQATRHGVLTVIVVRLAFVVPYLLQNIVLAMTNLSLIRLLGLTLLGAVPGVVSYSFLGAGLVSLESTQSFVVLISVPLLMLVLVSAVIPYLRRRMNSSSQRD